MASTGFRKVLCSGSQDRNIRLWSLDTFHGTKVISGHNGEVLLGLYVRSASHSKKKIIPHVDKTCYFFQKISIWVR